MMDVTYYSTEIQYSIYGSQMFTFIKQKSFKCLFTKYFPAYLRIYDTGLMMYSARVNYDLSCPMVFDNYPVDEQVCDIVFERY